MLTPEQLAKLITESYESNEFNAFVHNLGLQPGTDEHRIETFKKLAALYPKSYGKDLSLEQVSGPPNEEAYRGHGLYRFAAPSVSIGLDYEVEYTYFRRWSLHIPKVTKAQWAKKTAEQGTMVATPISYQNWQGQVLKMNAYMDAVMPSKVGGWFLVPVDHNMEGVAIYHLQAARIRAVG